MIGRIKEFGRLYRSVFSNPDPYISVVTALGTKKIGMPCRELVQAVRGLNNDGKLTALNRIPMRTDRNNLI